MDGTSSKQTRATSADPNDWKLAAEVWREFITKHPELCLGETEATRSRFISRHRGTLHAQGVILRVGRSHYLLHRQRFAQVAWRCACGLSTAAEHLQAA
jgi:hypothetical protein